MYKKSSNLKHKFLWALNSVIKIYVYAQTICKTDVFMKYARYAHNILICSLNTYLTAFVELQKMIIFKVYGKMMIYLHFLLVKFSKKWVANKIKDFNTFFQFIHNIILCGFSSDGVKYTLDSLKPTCSN